MQSNSSIWLPSGSESVLMIMRLYRKFLILKLSPMPQPKQVRISLIMEDLVISANSLPHVFKILPRKGNTACDGFLVSQAPPAAESIRCFTSYRPFLWLTWLTIMRFDSQVLRFLKHWHVSIVSLLSNNGDGLYRLCNIFWFVF